MSDLWALKVAGDVYPAPSQHEAEAKERELAAFLVAAGRKNVTVEAIIWGGSEAEHAAGLPMWAPAKAN